MVPPGTERLNQDHGALAAESADCPFLLGAIHAQHIRIGRGRTIYDSRSAFP
jgi:hypothetical protein